MNNDFLGGNAYMVNKHLNNLVDRADVENAFERYKNVIMYFYDGDDPTEFEDWIDTMTDAICNDLFNK